MNDEMMSRGNWIAFSLVFFMSGFVAWFNYPYGLLMFVFPALIMALGMGKQQQKRDVKAKG